MASVASEEEKVGRQFVKEFYLFLVRKSGCKEIDREFVKRCSISQKIILLEQFMDYLQGMYRRTGEYQSVLLEEFKSVPGEYFDIDQKKIKVTLKALPKKLHRNSDSTCSEEDKKAEVNPPVILLNSKKLTNLQMERFPHNDFLDLYTPVKNSDLKVLEEVLKLIAEEVESSVKK